MKKLIYSAYTKFIAAALCVVCIVLAALTVTNGLTKCYDEKDFIYGFENDFSETDHFQHLLDAPAGAVFEAYHNFYYRADEKEEIRYQNRTMTVDGKTWENYLYDMYYALDALLSSDKINFFIQINGYVISNCGAASADELMSAQFYQYSSRDADGNTSYETSQPRYYNTNYLEDIARYDATSTITICTSIKDSYAEECRIIWERQAALVNNALTGVFVFAVLALLLLIYLICVAGQNKDGGHTAMWLDSVWTEIHLIVMGGFGLGGVYLCVILLNEYTIGHFPLYLLRMAVGTVSALASAALLTSLLSVIRNIKCKKFVESSIILRTARWVWRTAINVTKWFFRKCKACKKLISGALSKKTGTIYFALLLVYTAIIGLCGIFVVETPAAFVTAIISFGFTCVFVAYRAKELDEVKKGVSEIRRGNLAYKIPELKSDDMRLMANDVNEIAMGLDESVAAKLKAERLKTELITNVSHDLKTPLTSIISYTELLSKVAGLPEEARDYTQIIAQKSDRLKNLTQDLFDISKVQSGNEKIVFEKLDIALLVNQSLGEHDNEIQESGLKFCVDAPKELYISADGRKMSRVMSNLINNILKYTMKGTRVFIAAFEKNNEITIEFKNIASYPMDFNADEIVGRFVRGDESRTAEGNGLGLAIAKSYTEACGGKFDIVLDGDMFKAIITFNKHAD